MSSKLKWKKDIPWLCSSGICINKTMHQRNKSHHNLQSISSFYYQFRWSSFHYQFWTGSKKYKKKQYLPQVKHFKSWFPLSIYKEKRNLMILSTLSLEKEAFLNHVSVIFLFKTFFLWNVNVLLKKTGISYILKLWLLIPLKFETNLF